MNGVRGPIRENFVALVSLVVALSALGYNTWRNERTERNRNVREAGVEMLREIGSLQQIIIYAHYGKRDAHGELVDAAALRATWQADAEHLGEQQVAFTRIDGAIDALRQTTLAELRALR